MEKFEITIPNSEISSRYETITEILNEDYNRLGKLNDLFDSIYQSIMENPATKKIYDNFLASVGDCEVEPKVYLINHTISSMIDIVAANSYQEKDKK